ncbi:MAG: ATP-binding protein [Bacillota bacterium]
MIGDLSGRSQKIELLPGNEVALRIIGRAVSTGRVANAYLLKGPKGSPKDLIADLFAEDLLCDSPDNEGRSCGSCWSCRSAAASQHPDLFRTEREGANIKIKKSHEMLKEALLKPYHSARKVFIVKDAEDMTIEASNALLKILEEPPAYVTFILTTGNPSAIPETILSRCQIVPVRALSPAILEEILVGEGRDPILAREAARLSGGNLDRARRVIERAAGGVPRGEEVLAEVLSAPVVDIAQKYAKTEPRERLDLLDDLEIELVKRLRQGERESPLVLQALKSVMAAKDRLESSTNAFLTFAVLFIDLGRALKRIKAN